MTASGARQSPWPYGIAAGLGLVVAVNLWVAHIATADPPVVEADRPYEVGEAYQQEIEASRVSAQLGYRAEVTAAGGRLRVALVDRAGHPVAGLEGDIRVERPDRRDRDQRAVLAEAAPGVYEAVADLNPAGVWRVHTTLADGRGTWMDDRRMWIAP